jgi:peptidoglycan/xylan/chitin deacetylase (PgdA/CDA1 family)
MARDPLIEFGSHGMSHRDLSALPPEEASREAALSKAVLEERLGRPVRYFSYPHGAWNERVKEAVVSSGYQAAFSVISRNEGRYSLRRVLISRSDGLFRLRLKLSPLYWPLRRVM